MKRSWVVFVGTKLLKVRCFCILACLAGASSASAGLITLYTNPAAVPSGTAQAIDNPVKAGGLVSDTSGSLFFSATVPLSGFNNWLSVGVWEDSTVAGEPEEGVDLGRGSGPPAILVDYMDPGVNVTTYSPALSLSTGRYLLVGEIAFTTASSGMLRMWAIDTNATTVVNFDAPGATDTFSSGFSPAPDDIYLHVRSGGATTWSDRSAVWAEEEADRWNAFLASLPNGIIGVPEPSPVALIGVATLVLTGLFRRRSQREHAGRGRTTGPSQGNSIRDEKLRE